jgi:hypothetical protein
MSAASTASAAASQFTAVTAANEFQLHLPFKKDEPVQPYCDAKVKWPLTDADFQLFKTENKASNAHAKNNLGLPTASCQALAPGSLFG